MSTIINRIAVKEAAAHLNEQVTIKGHVHSLKDLGGLLFINVRDASGIVQAVVENESVLCQVRGIKVETPVRVVGTVVSRNGGSACEIKAEKIDQLGVVVDTLPVEIAKEKKMDALSLGTLLDYRPITLRSPKVRAIFKLEAEITRAFRQFLAEQRFVEIHSPKIVATGTEGGAQLFKLDYFGKPAYLAQSPQFYKQIMVGVFERVFEVAPVYRAEEHDTTRHLNEYISLDFEMGFIESEQDVIDMQVRLLKHVFDHVRSVCAEELAMYGATVPQITSIPRLRLDEAIGILQKNYAWGANEPEDLDPEGERLLCEHFHRETGSELVYVTNYPLAARPFYTMPFTDTAYSGKPLSRGFDLLFRGLEVTTGGQRIHDYEQLHASISKRGLNPEDFKEYLQCFRYGMPPHGGLAIGLERLAKQLLNLPSVKQTALFPRDLNRLRP